MKEINGNLLDQSPGILCHQVNVHGVMGAGLAIQIAKKWPHVLHGYETYCNFSPQLGDCLFTEACPNVIVANLFGQSSISRSRCVTRYSVYPKMLKEVKEESERKCIPIYIPFGIGCGLAGGDWKTMKLYLQKYLPQSIIVRLST